MLLKLTPVICLMLIEATTYLFVPIFLLFELVINVSLNTDIHLHIIYLFSLGC